ncbi:metallophosphoesterase family protein [candidate division KSB1 bacterium]|nr:metallophosphoesterase family protein [candidate division KSB1 bacterium]
MRVAAIYDIHGNLPALEAVLQDIRQTEVDHVVVGGDVVPGPMPRETLACLLDLDIPVQFIQGNGEREGLAQMAGTETGAVPEQFRGIVRWAAQQLHPEHERLLASWPKTLWVEIRGLGEVLFCHATPRSDTEVFTRLTPEDRLLPIFEGVNVPVVICGHTHMQFDRTIGRIRVVNAGSVGMPFGEPEEVQYYYPFPLKPSSEAVVIPHRGNFQFRDEFTAEKLNYNWVFLRTPREKWYDLKSRKDFLAMQVRPESCAGNMNPSFLGHRQQHLQGSATVAIDFSPKAENEKAGLLIFQNEQHFYFLCKSLEGNAAAIQLYKSGDDQMALMASQTLNDDQKAKSVYLKIEARGAAYAFSFATNPDEWILLQDNVDGRFLSVRIPDSFVGCMYALYATSLGKPSENSAHFDWFEYSGNDEVYK